MLISLDELLGIIPNKQSFKKLEHFSLDFHYLRLYINSFLIFLVCKGNKGAPESFSKPKIKVNFRSYNSSLRIKSEQ